MKICLFFFLIITLGASAQQPSAPAPAPAAPTVPVQFAITPAFPKYVTADIEFRDPTGVKWPNFFYGKPGVTPGVVTLDPAKPAASFTLLCDKMSQDRGDQSRRVLGELCPPEKPPVVTLTITALSGFVPASTTGKQKTPATADLSGTLEIAGRKIPVKAATTLRNHDGRGDEKNAALMLDGKFALKPADLGLKTLAPNSGVDVRFSVTAFPPEAAAAAAAKKK